MEEHAVEARVAAVAEAAPDLVEQLRVAVVDEHHVAVVVRRRRP